MKKADKTIIEANPDLSPHQLLTQKGLSEAGFNELVDNIDQQSKAALDANKPKLKPQGIITPIVTNSQLIPTLSQSDKVRLVPKSGGLGTEMNRSAAQSAMRRQPHKYTIIG